MSKARWIILACVLALLIGGAVFVGMPRTMEVAIPMLREDGSLGATIVKLQRPGGLLASTLVKVRGFSNPVRFFASNETSNGQLLPFTPGPPDDVLLKLCAETDIGASNVFNGPPGPGADAWFYRYTGDYIARTAAGQETNCVKTKLNANANATIDECFGLDAQRQPIPGWAGVWGGFATGFESFVNPNGRITVPAGQEALVFASAVSPTGTRTAQCKPSVCGNGIVQSGEQCDDGNTINTDGCTNVCTLPRCGDGIVQAGEQCDDGNTSQNDLCLNTCVANVCGDGHAQRSFPVAEPGDPCDDGNTVSGDGCSATCVTEQLYNCEGLNPDVCKIPMMGGGSPPP